MLLVLRLASASKHQARYMRESAGNAPVLLIEDGVYQYFRLKDKQQALYVHKNDALTRGIEIAQIHECSDEQIIQLTEKYPHWIEVK